MSAIIFQHTLPQVMDGSKTETTRLWHHKTLYEFDGVKSIMSKKDRKLMTVGKQYVIKSGRNSRGVWMHEDSEMYFTPDKALIGEIGNQWKLKLRDKGHRPAKILVEDLLPTELLSTEIFGSARWIDEGFETYHDFLWTWCKMHDESVYQAVSKELWFSVSRYDLRDIILKARAKKYPERYTGYIIKFSLSVE